MMNSKQYIAALAGILCAFGAAAADGDDYRDGLVAELSQKISQAGQAALEQMRSELANSMQLELRLAPLMDLRVARADHHQTGRL